MPALYDDIGVDYARLRRPDPRIAAVIEAALGDAQTILNVGAGAGSYEPDDRSITAVEPSLVMIRQRPDTSGPAACGVAERLPFQDGQFDAAMAILTVHHWTDQAAGLRELRRVTRGPAAILTFDAAAPFFWLGDYLPELPEIDKRQMPPMQFYEDVLGPVEIRPVPLPHDCVDGVLAAYWRRPTAYLDARVQAATSSLARMKDVDARLSGLRQDLETGELDRKYGRLNDLEELDCGYRLVVSSPGSSRSGVD